jgi:adenosylmethionine-8-amino-7-oxononanoate aminotransferase
LKQYRQWTEHKTMAANSKLFLRDLKHPMPTIVAGEGAYLIDSSGKRYLDASGGPSVSCLGHNHPEVVAAIRDQVGKVSFAYSLFFTTPAIEELAEILVDQAPKGIARAFFVGSGSEAIEAALKLARQYFLEIGQPKRRLFIARERSYHGNTLGALALGGDAVRRAPYEPLLMPVTHISPCYEYRGRQAEESAEAYGRRVADELETAINRLGPENVAAFFFEPVVGGSLGCAPAVDGYARRIREICDRHGVLLVADEVMCGMGRTGRMFACEEDGITPDLITIAKGLGGGFVPIGGLLLSERVFQAIVAGSGNIRHGQTYAGHTLSCAGALAVQRVIKEQNLLSLVREMGAYLKKRLNETFGQHPNVGDIRGRGFFLGLELVADRDTKAPLDPGRRTWDRIRRAGMEEGLICYPGGGCIDGVRGDHVILSPSFLSSVGEIEEMIEKLRKSISKALR